MAQAETPAQALIDRLRSEDASPVEWRSAALSRYTEGRADECERLLEACVDIERPLCSAASVPEQVSNMCLLAELSISRAVAASRPPPAEVEQLLAKAKSLLDRADALDLGLGQMSSAESFIAKGYYAIAKHVLRVGRQGDELKRAEILFDAALKMDGACPKALLGRAVVLAQYKEWGKALGSLRQVLQRAAPRAPRAGLRLRCLKELRFAIATCFCDLRRFGQMRNALTGVISADAGDVESLCALAHLEAKVAADGVGKSLGFLSKAASVNREHPVVMLHLANHAFYCGMEDGAGGEPEGQQPWELAEELLSKALSTTKSAPVEAEAHFQLGRLRHAQGKYAEAQKEYRSCVDLESDHQAGAFCLAQTCVQQGGYDEAVKLLERVRTCRSESLEVLKLLTFSYLKLGDRASEAAKCADALVAKAPKDMEAWTMRAEAHDQLAALQPSSAQKVGIEVYEQVAKLLQESNGETNGSRQWEATPQMWNNLGTLRSLQGDPRGAKEAYGRGLALAEQQLQGENGHGPSTTDEAKDLHIACLTMRFNRAWLAESEGDQPDFLQATQDYMAINEEHHWHADSLLQLGAQWARMGETESALHRYQEAMKSNPFHSAIMQAELYRQRGEYPKALQSAELAVQVAGDKQFHYAHVLLGNLYFEVAIAPSTRQRERDTFMHKALRNFTKALEHKKDSHYAANGVGMVFARRGKSDFARRTFQSVMQHHALSGDPCAFINLGHTYLLSGGENARKALALYERARALKPHDLDIRLYLAKAHFALKQYDRCIDVLSDATQIWPDDLLLRYNLAVSLESYGVHLVSEERKMRRVVGVDNAMEQMNHAIQLLNSAARLFEYVYKQWIDMSDEARRALVLSSGMGDTVADEMLAASTHKLYCADIQAKAQEELVHLQARRAEIERRVQENASKKAEELRMEQEQLQRTAEKNQDEAEEANDRARDLEEKARGMDIGKNLEAKTLDKKTAAKPKEPKEKEPREGRRSKAKALTDGEGEGADGEERREKRRHRRKDKRGKKEKKHRRHRKRGRDGDDEGEEEEDVDKDKEVSKEDSLPSKPDGDAEDGQTDLPMADGKSDEEGGRKEKKRRRRHEKKDRKGKKHKKEHKRRRRSEAASADDAEALFEPAAGDPDDDKAAEEELFGSDGEP